METLVELRSETNSFVVRKTKEMSYAEDLFKLNTEDYEHGARSEARIFTPDDDEGMHLARRIPVREERAQGWRTRAVDHLTESLQNEACRPCDVATTNSAETLIEIIGVSS